jgi:hypothetical protein
MCSEQMYSFDFNSRIFLSAFIGNIDQMQDAANDELITPELLDLLSQIANTEVLDLESSVSLSTDTSLCTIFGRVTETVASRADSETRGVFRKVPKDQAPRLYAGTPTNGMSSSNDSFASFDTTGSSRSHLSPKNQTAQLDVGYIHSYGSQSPTASAPTTLMLKNIPNRVSREDLVCEILSKMPPSSFDFFYIPQDFKTKSNFGYGFINCTSDEAVDHFVACFHKRRLACAGNVFSKPLEVTIARVQGFTANVNRLISSPVLFEADEGSLPLIFNRDQISIPFRALMQLNRASILFQTRPPIEDLIAMVEAEMLHKD